MFKNRIGELEDSLSSLYNSRGSKEEQLEMEYKKFKTLKDKQVADLQSEMEKYGQKVNELEESNYLLKREVERLQESCLSMEDENKEMEEHIHDLKYEIKELEEEKQFYKKRNLAELNNLLNETQ